jgi:hypothetical protein
MQAAQRFEAQRFEAHSFDIEQPWPLLSSVQSGKPV